MSWLNRFMKGRYGGDQLSIALLIFSVLLTLIAQLAGVPLLWFIGYIPLAISLFRMFSRNISKRSMENYKFAMFMSPAYSKYKKIQRRIKELKTHRFFKCPNCKSKLRLPRGKGKIIIICPKCETKFPKKT